MKQNYYNYKVVTLSMHYQALPTVEDDDFSNILRFF